MRTNGLTDERTNELWMKMNERMNEAERIITNEWMMYDNVKSVCEGWWIDDVMCVPVDLSPALNEWSRTYKYADYPQNGLLGPAPRLAREWKWWWWMKDVMSMMLWVWCYEWMCDVWRWMNEVERKNEWYVWSEYRTTAPAVPPKACTMAAPSTGEEWDCSTWNFHLLGLGHGW